MQKHAKLSASKAHRWIACPGSIRLEEQLEPSDQQESSYAREGTVAHKYAAKTLLLRIDHSTDESIAKAEVPFDMEYAIRMYVDHIIEQVGQGMIQYGIEAKAPYDDIVEGGFGTCDAWVYNENTKILHIVDFKYGRGVAVTASENYQLSLYAYGIATRLDMLGVPIENIQMWVVQPRSANGEQISCETLTLDALLERSKFMAERGAIALQPDAPLVPGDEQCRWCPAKLICPALNNIVEEVVNNSAEDVVPLTGEKLAEILFKKALVEQYLKEAQTEAMRRLMENEEVPGYRLVRGRANRKWIDSAESILSEILGEEAYERKLIGLTKAQKLVDASTMAELTVKPRGQLKIVTEDYTLARGEEEHSLEDGFEELD